MIYPVEEKEFEQITRDLEKAGKFTESKFNPDSSEVTTGRNLFLGNRSVYGLQYSQKLLTFRCWRCNSRFLISECDNCGSTSFHIHHEGNVELPSGKHTVVRHYVCTCGNRISNWLCSKCGSSNTVSYWSNYQLQKAGGCFVASVCFGSESAPEVLALKEFRDEILLKCRLGRMSVNLYYRLSPSISHFLSTRKTPRKWVRIFLLQPIAKVLERLRVKNQGKSSEPDIFR